MLPDSEAEEQATGWFCTSRWRLPEGLESSACGSGSPTYQSLRLCPAWLDWVQGMNLNFKYLIKPFIPHRVCERTAMQSNPGRAFLLPYNNKIFKYTTSTIIFKAIVLILQNVQFWEILGWSVIRGEKSWKFPQRVESISLPRVEEISSTSQKSGHTCF